MNRRQHSIDRAAKVVLVFALATFIFGWCVFLVASVLDVPEFIGFIAYFCTALPVIPAFFVALGILIQISL